MGSVTRKSSAESGSANAVTMRISGISTVPAIIVGSTVWKNGSSASTRSSVSVSAPADPRPCRSIASCRAVRAERRTRWESCASMRDFGRRRRAIDRTHKNSIRRSDAVSVRPPCSMNTAFTMTEVFHAAATTRPPWRSSIAVRTRMIFRCVCSAERKMDFFFFICISTPDVLYHSERYACGRCSTSRSGIQGQRGRE